MKVYRLTNTIRTVYLMPWVINKLSTDSSKMRVLFGTTGGRKIIKLLESGVYCSR
jgi:hypothetical protein